MTLRQRSLNETGGLAPAPIAAYDKHKVTVKMTFDPATDRTKQSFKAESDINHIMARFQKTGVIAFQQRFAPTYGDVSGADFQRAMQVVARSKSMFAELPAHLRDRFNNDPKQFLDFVQNDANRPEAEKLGLLKPGNPATVESASLTTQGDDNELTQDRPRTQGTRRTGAPRKTERGTERDPTPGDRETT